MLIEKSRMRTTELERLTALLRQLDEEYTAKQGQLNDSEKSVAGLR
jgi:chromosome segregation protein